MSDDTAFLGLVAEMEIDPSALGEPTDGGTDANLPEGDGGSGLAGIDIDSEEDLGGAPSTTASDELVEDDASGAGSWKSEASSDSESEYSFEMSEESSDEIPDEPGPAPDVPAAGLYSADLILTAAAMSQRALRMFTGGTGVPVSSGQGSVAEPATWELLMLVEMTLLRLRSSRRRSAGRCS